MYYLLYSLNALLMILIPIALGWFIARRRQVSWGLFGIGAVTFIVAQVGHIPFNLALVPGLRRALEGQSELFNLVVVSVFLGLSAFVDLFITPEDFYLFGMVPGRDLVEDGFKLLGIVGWSFYFVLHAVNTVGPHVGRPAGEGNA